MPVNFTSLSGLKTSMNKETSAPLSKHQQVNWEFQDGKELFFFFKNPALPNSPQLGNLLSLIAKTAKHSWQQPLVLNTCFFLSRAAWAGDDTVKLCFCDNSICTNERLLCSGTFCPLKQCLWEGVWKKKKIIVLLKHCRICLRKTARVQSRREKKRSPVSSKCREKVERDAQRKHLNVEGEPALGPESESERCTKLNKKGVRVACWAENILLKLSSIGQKHGNDGSAAPPLTLMWCTSRWFTNDPIHQKLNMKQLLTDTIWFISIEAQDCN